MAKRGGKSANRIFCNDYRTLVRRDECEVMVSQERDTLDLMI